MGQRIDTAAGVPIMRISHPLGYARFLRSVGVPVDSAFRRARLPLLCEDPNSYVPVVRAKSFYEDMARREIEALGWETGRWAHENSLHHGLLKRLAAAPTLGRALLDFSALAPIENSNYRLGITLRGEDVLFWVHDTLITDMPGYNIGLSYALWVMLGVVRHFAGASWWPDEIGIRDAAVPAGVRDMIPCPMIIPAQKRYYLRFPKAFLSLPPEQHWAADQFRQPSESPLTLAGREGFTGTLQLVLESYLVEGAPTVEEAAALVGTSNRTLRRRLEGEGTTYSDLIDQVRFDVAKRLLHDSDVKMIDISNALGYSDPSHFARGFRRIAGVSPSVYRRDMLQLASSNNHSIAR